MIIYVKRKSCPWHTISTISIIIVFISLVIIGKNFWKVLYFIPSKNIFDKIKIYGKLSITKADADDVFDEKYNSHSSIEVGIRFFMHFLMSIQITQK